MRSRAGGSPRRSTIKHTGLLAYDRRKTIADSTGQKTCHTAASRRTAIKSRPSRSLRPRLCERARAARNRIIMMVYSGFSLTVALKVKTEFYRRMSSANRARSLTHQARGASSIKSAVKCSALQHQRLTCRRQCTVLLSLLLMAAQAAHLGRCTGHPKPSPRPTRNGTQSDPKTTAI